MVSKVILTSIYKDTQKGSPKDFSWQILPSSWTQHYIYLESYFMLAIPQVNLNRKVIKKKKDSSNLAICHLFLLALIKFLD